jgi:DNA-binding CsgD family transcriptional regulator
MLLPYRDQGVVSGRGLSYIGAVSLYLGLLATTLIAVEGPDPPGTDPGFEPPTPEIAVRHFEDALAFDSHMGARACLAQARYDYAAFLIRLQRPPPAPAADPCALLNAALSTARALGMERLVMDAERLLASYRPAPPPAAAVAPAPVAAAPALPAALTQREVEVLRLLAAGMSNAQIAETLVLSVRTVERHLANLYPKINARNRADAAAFAVRHHLA